MQLNIEDRNHYEQLFGREDEYPGHLRVEWGRVTLAPGRCNGMVSALKGGSIQCFGAWEPIKSAFVGVNTGKHDYQREFGPGVYDQSYHNDPYQVGPANGKDFSASRTSKPDYYSGPVDGFHAN